MPVDSPMKRKGSIARGLGVAIRRCAAVLAFAAMAVPAASAQPLSFGVIPQRTATLTAQYWNPILNYLGTRSGVALELKLARSGPEHASMIASGGFDLAYSNHHLAPGNQGAGYRAFARPRGAPIHGEIVVLEHSPIRSLEELHGKEVGFPSRAAFIGYQVPIDTLARARIKVQPVFGGTQEGIIGQLRAGGIAAAGVNSQVVRDFAERESVGYRVLWRSEPFHNIPLIAHQRVPAAALAAVLAALLAMADDPEGSQVLAAGARLLKLDPPFGFVAANERDYDDARNFLRAALPRVD
jgi:phosphonate transport system substrate-binding protein